MKRGVYYTIYGNACKYNGGKTAYDIDMGEKISLDMVDFTKYIGKLSDY